MAQVDAAAPLIERPPTYRWMQLFLGIVCMVMIANLQYGWTLFVNPIERQVRLGAAPRSRSHSRSSSSPRPGSCRSRAGLVDRFGPRPVVLVGGLLCAIGWVMNSYADSLTTALHRRCDRRDRRPAPSTAPAWATRSNGFPTGAASPPG